MIVYTIQTWYLREKRAKKSGIKRYVEEGFFRQSRKEAII
jgi:hypothetical protein